jgi:aspartate kinase
MSHQPSLLVLKFGGASLATPARIRRAARRVSWLRAKGHDVVVVASAVGHTTDRLLALVERTRSTSEARSTRHDERQLARETDRILATGEDLAAALLASAITAQGRHARSLRGGEAGLLATGDFGAGELLDLALSPILDLLRAQVVPVVSGFQAIRVHDGETVTLGRGTSDLTAVFLASKLRAVECHLIKDVDGVYDSDPNRFAAAERHPTLSYEALVDIAATSEIVHAGAARLARESGVRLRIYGYRAPNKVTDEHCTRVGGEKGAASGAATQAASAVGEAA